MSLMAQEIHAIPQQLLGMVNSAPGVLDTLAKRLQQHAPPFVISIARGSSDHAAGYFAYHLMRSTGIPMMSMPLSLASLYHAPLRLQGAWAMAFSQSGQSTDLLHMQQGAQRGGASTIAFVNNTESPLAQAADHVVDVGAGEERSVAATKSFMGQAVAGMRMLCWADHEMAHALHQLPDAIGHALVTDHTPVLDLLQHSTHALVLSRGAGLPIAMEMALKLKECTGIHAEAISSAEFRHGPMAMVSPSLAVVVVATPGPEQAGSLALANELHTLGVPVCVMTDAAAASTLAGISHVQVPQTNSTLAPLVALTGFYLAVEQLARLRGLLPDTPKHLRKVTITK